MKSIVALIIVGIIFGGCASSKVVLLEGKKSGTSVVVATKGGEQILDKPNTYTELSSTTAKPSKVQAMNKKEMEENYGTLMQTTPKPPVSFLLYFTAGSTIIADESKAQFSLIEDAIKERAPCDVNIIGHADREGSKEYNIKLSLKRAKSVQEWLMVRELDIDLITVESYGEEDPIIKTEDGVAEPKNRRVEVLIR